MTGVSSKLVLKLDIEKGKGGDVRREIICIRIIVKAGGEYEITSRLSELEQLEIICLLARPIVIFP